METSSRVLCLSSLLTKRRRTGFALVALGLGGGVLTLTALIQFAGYLPPVVQASQPLVTLVRGYFLAEPLMNDYSSPRYLGLLGVGIGIYFLLPRARWRRVFLLLFSAFLVLALAPIPVLLTASYVPVLILAGIAALTFFVHLLARAAAFQRGFAVGGIVGIVMVYAGILALPSLADAELIPQSVKQTVVQHLILKEFFMFLVLKSIHYLWDVAAGRAEACSLETLALWLLFFPSFRNAPFERVQSFVAQTEAMPDTVALGRVGHGLKRILVGAIKGAGAGLVRSYLPLMGVWATPSGASAGQLWLAAYGYTIALSLGFSGYADVMIGSSALLGYRLTENFDRPYHRFDVRGFWRGWNAMTSRWFRDYVYIPLGGSRKGNVYLNLFVTMFLSGIWHAARANFVIWGVWHGLGLAISRYFFERRQRAGHPEPSLNAGVPWLRLKWLLGAFATFHFVTVGWVFHHNGYAGIGVLDSLHMVARMFALR